MKSEIVEEVVQEVLTVLAGKGIPRLALIALERVLPVLLPWAIQRVQAGIDPGADQEALMKLAETQADAAADAKFGKKP